MAYHELFTFPVGTAIKPAPRRTATSVIESLVALTLLTTLLTVSTPLVVRHGRMLAAQRAYRIALDELTNQLDRLSATAPDEVSAAVDQLALTPFAAARLPGAKLTGRLEPANFGQRLRLEISYADSQLQTSPVTLVAWVPAASQPSEGETAEEEPQ
jgi:hypothetical protein